MYLFDTDTITNILKKRPSQNLVRKLENLDKSCQFISAITIAEIMYGAYKSSDPVYHIEKLEKVLLPTVNVVGFEERAAYVCGKIRAELEKKGQPLSFADLQIASVAIANNLTLITGNTKHFERISELKIDDWL